MNFEKINNLLIKYFDGDTSLAEENILRGYFSSKNVDEQFAKYQPYFSALNKEKNIKTSEALTTKIDAISTPKRPVMQVVKSTHYWWKMAATVALIIVGTWAVAKQFKPKESPQIANPQPFKPNKRKAKVIILDETTSPELALVEVEKALMLVSKNMKKGTDETTEGLQKVRTATKVLRN
jgi:hypothetical protein